MNFFLRFLIFALGLTAGLLLLKYVGKIVYTLGKSGWAEQKLGTGGTFTLWRFAAVALIVVTFLIALFS